MRVNAIYKKGTFRQINGQNKLTSYMHEGRKRIEGIVALECAEPKRDKATLRDRNVAQSFRGHLLVKRGF